MFVIDKLPIDVLLGMTFIDEHILYILPEEQKITVRNSDPFAVIAQGNMPVNEAFTKRATEKVTKTSS